MVADTCVTFQRSRGTFSVVRKRSPSRLNSAPEIARRPAAQSRNRRSDQNQSSMKVSFRTANQFSMTVEFRERNVGPDFVEDSLILNVAMN
jgi:hypothetical protein